MLFKPNWFTSKIEKTKHIMNNYKLLFKKLILNAITIFFFESLTCLIGTCSKSARLQNPLSQIREPLTDRGLGVTVIEKKILKKKLINKENLKKKFGWILNAGRFK